MTKQEATAAVWDITTPLLGFVGFGAVLLLALALIGLVSKW